MKEYRGKIILTSVVTVLPIVIGLLLWNRLPDTIATHFTFDNVANGWSSKPFTVLGLPIILTVLHLVAVMLSVVFWIVPIVSWVMFLSIYTNALNMSINISMISGVLVGTIFLVTGNYMSKNRQNYTVGIKLPWTLNSTENWNRTNRFAGRLWLVAGAIMLVNIFLNQTAILIGMIVVIGVAPVIYSYVLYKKGI